MIESKDIKNLLKWLKIREANGYSMPNDSDGLMIAAVKSSLLERMLDGKDPLAVPPPRSYSYPWYELIENGEGQPTDVYKTEGLEKDIFGNCLVINQMQWIILREEGPENWIVTYNYGPHLEKEIFDGEWRVNKKEDDWSIKKIK